MSEQIYTPICNAKDLTFIKTKKQNRNEMYLKEDISWNKLLNCL